MQNFCIKPNLYPSKVFRFNVVQNWCEHWKIEIFSGKSHLLGKIDLFLDFEKLSLFEIRSNKNFLIRESPVPYFGLCTLTKLLFQRSLNLEGVVKITSINGAYLRVCSNCWRLRIKIYKRVSKFMKSYLNLYSPPEKYLRQLIFRWYYGAHHFSKLVDVITVH